MANRDKLYSTVCGMRKQVSVNRTNDVWDVSSERRMFSGSHWNRSRICKDGKTVRGHKREVTETQCTTTCELCSQCVHVGLNMTEYMSYQPCTGTCTVHLQYGVTTYKTRVEACIAVATRSSLYGTMQQTADRLMLRFLEA